MNNIDIFSCLCFLGWIGERCEFIDICLSILCYNNGSCIVDKKGIICICVLGWIGLICNEVDYCYGDFCRNNGICVNGLIGYFC